MRKLLVLAFSAFAVVGLIGSASAGQLTWRGQGSENLPCSDGGHWVLTGKGVTSATATIGGRTYTMLQNGGGSWAVDSFGSIASGTAASVVFTGTPNNPQFVLSHCNAGYGGYPDPYAN